MLSAARLVAGATIPQPSVAFRPRRRLTAGGSEVEDDGDGGDARLPEGCGSTRRWRGLWRSSEACQGGEGRPVAMATASDGGGCARGRENQGGGRARGRGKGPGRLRGDVPDVQASRGRTDRQVPWRHDGAHAPATRPWPPGARRGTTGASQSAGPASWAAQGRGGPGKSLLPFISVFFFNFLTFV